MLFRSCKPRGPLREFVEDIWLYEDYAGEHQRERILPSGTFEIVFNLREDELRIYGSANPNEHRRYTGALISGPYAGSFMSDTAEEAGILGVHFRPGGAFAILGLPAGEFANTHIDLRTIWGPSASALHERLCSLTSSTERFRLVEQALMARISDPPIRHGVVHRGLEVLMRTHGGARIRDIASAADLSQRRFIEVFTAEVGLTPKLFGRIQRFQRAITLSRHTAKADWAELAVECGCFDPSHLIRDFIEFSGVSPADFRRWQSRLDQAGIHMKRNHLPLAG
jgi:AraC-like DNA-binding protein